MGHDLKMSFDAPFLTYGEGRKKEWLLGNGLGGYASSTIIGMNTRKYHGLLVAALEPPVKRWLLLSKIEEEVLIGKEKYLLSANSYGDVVYPEGNRHQASFDFDPFPTFTYSVGGIMLEKSVFMPHGQNAAFVSYRIENAGEPFELRLRPLVSSRSIHSNLHSGASEWAFEEEAGKRHTRITASFESAPSLFLKCSSAAYEPNAFWVYNMFYEVENSRGYDDRDDLYSPGEFVKRCEEGSTHLDILALGGTDGALQKTADALCSARPELLESERNRLASIENKLFMSSSLAYDPKIALLSRAADSFIVERKSTGSKSIIAGYHWFSDWGRDAMIALPGIALVTGRFEEAKDILRTFARSSKEGLVPNRFLDSGGADYNSADASLWFFIAVHKFLEHTGDYSFVAKELWGTMKEIVASYRSGTRFGIRMAEDGLISAGDESTQITWMDAKVGDTAITPRNGKPVELNALWYNALRVMEKLELRLGSAPEEYEDLAGRVEKAFNEAFWNAEQECLYDVVSDDRKDPSIRPNQIFAVSLPYPLLDDKKARKVVLKVMEELYTPYGLRSLSPRDSRYRGTYYGNHSERDSAYHQGTAWPWLMGPFISAYVRVNGSTGEAKKRAFRLISPLMNHLGDAGLGTISEIFDGNAPFTPRGCISQAWSVGELLRCVVEDL